MWRCTLCRIVHVDMQMIAWTTRRDSVVWPGIHSKYSRLDCSSFIQLGFSECLKAPRKTWRSRSDEIVLTRRWRRWHFWQHEFWVNLFAPDKYVGAKHLQPTRFCVNKTLLCYVIRNILRWSRDSTLVPHDAPNKENQSCEKSKLLKNKKKRMGSFKSTLAATLRKNKDGVDKYIFWKVRRSTKGCIIF